MAIYCNNCGTELPDGASFCDNCGQTIKMVAKSDIPAPNIPAPNIPDPNIPASNIPAPEAISASEAVQPVAENPYYSTEKKKSKIPVIPIAIAVAAVLVIGIGVGAFFLIRGKGGDGIEDGKVATETAEKKKAGFGLFGSGIDVTQIDGGKIKWDQRDAETLDTVNISTEEDPLPENYMVGTWLKCYENIDKDPSMSRTLSDNPSEWKTNISGRMTFADDGTYISERWYVDNPDAKTTVSGKYYFDDLNNYEDHKLQTYIIILYTDIDEYRIDPGAPEIIDERLEWGRYTTGLTTDKAFGEEIFLSLNNWTPEREGGQYYRKITNDYHPELFNTANLQANTKSKNEQNKNANEEEVTLILNNDGNTEENNKDQTEESGNGTPSISFGSTENEEIDVASNNSSSSDSGIDSTTEANTGSITFGEPGDDKQNNKTDANSLNEDIATGGSSTGESGGETQGSITFGNDNNNSVPDNITITPAIPDLNDVTGTNNGSGNAAGPGTDIGPGLSGDSSSNVNSPAGDDAAPPSKAITGGTFDVLQSGETIYYMMNGQQAQDMWVKEMDKYYYIGYDKCLMYNNYASDGYYVGADGSWDKYIPRLTTTDKLQTGTYVYENGSDSVTWKFTMSPSGTYDGTAERIYSFGYSENYGVTYKGGSCYMLEGNGIYGSGPQITVLNGGERFIITDYGYSDRFTLKR